MAFGQIPSLIAFSPNTTILSASVNSNFNNITAQFNALVTGTNTLAPFTVSAGPITINGMTISGGVVSGLATFSSGWAISAGTASFVSGTTVSATAATILGAVTFSSGVTIASNSTLNVAGSTWNGAIAATNLAMLGLVTFSSGFVISAGVPTFASGLTITAGVVSAQGITGTNLTISGSGAGISVVATLVITAANAVAVAPNWGGAATATLFGVYVNPTDGGSASGSRIASFALGGTELVRIPKEGGMITQSATLVTAATRGYLYVPTMPTTGSATPVTETGCAPIAICTTNNTLQVFVGGAWKGVALT